MKNKLVVDFVPSVKSAGDLPLEEDKKPKTAPRETTAPKIVVCPPMEDMNTTLSVPRGSRLLRALGRRLSRRSNNADSDSTSSSDSVSEARTEREDRSSCSTSESGSDGSERRRRHCSTVSLRRVFQSLSLTSRSQSCSPSDRSRQSKKQPQPKRILRPPVTYTYVRGLSGLPTQRVPRRPNYCASSGLHR